MSAGYRRRLRASRDGARRAERREGIRRAFAGLFAPAASILDALRDNVSPSQAVGLVGLFVGIPAELWFAWWLS